LAANLLLTGQADLLNQKNELQKTQNVGLIENHVAIATGQAMPIAIRIQQQTGGNEIYGPHLQTGIARERVTGGEQEKKATKVGSSHLGL